MSKNADKFSLQLQNFLTAYIINERNYSINTLLSYSSTFCLLIEFLNDKYNIQPSKITFNTILSEDVILSFLDWCEDVRKASVSTRNQRLAAIKSFIKYVQRNNPDLVYSCSKILNIQNKKGSSKVISFFTEEEIKLIIDYVLKYKDYKTLVIISVLYETGTRVSELINIMKNDVILEQAMPSIIIRNGKGNKTRVVLISKELVTIIKRYLNKNYTDFGDGYLFYTKFKKPYTRFGIYDLINRIVLNLKVKYPDKFKGKYHPHSFRHAKATHLYNNGVPLLSIKEFLGHSSVTTTEIYATPDNIKIREQIMSGNKELGIDSKYNENEKNDLKEWLNNYVKKMK
ncbi:tyrosine-type recombinase/integrase [Thomasclavelia saccharogumia]|uniref:tyrosine-type recombinase/integrase n=1 Tax=Thomasclavelia saccharogumia TaxID=341225 RepID=UPI00047EB538|nr:tyrosine-type recombinase/integrase [Thomasclavelia saccharogumia]